MGDDAGPDGNRHLAGLARACPCGEILHQRRDITWLWWRVVDGPGHRIHHRALGRTIGAGSASPPGTTDDDDAVELADEEDSVNRDSSGGATPRPGRARASSSALPAPPRSYARRPAIAWRTAAASSGLPLDLGGAAVLRCRASWRRRRVASGAAEAARSTPRAASIAPRSFTSLRVKLNRGAKATTAPRPQDQHVIVSSLLVHLGLGRALTRTVGSGSLPTRMSTSGDEDRSAQPRPDGTRHTRRPARMRPVDVDPGTTRRPVAPDGPGTSRVMPGMPPVGHFSYGSIPALYRHRSNRRPCRSTSFNSRSTVGK